MVFLMPFVEYRGKVKERHLEIKKYYYPDTIEGTTQMR